MPISQNIKDVQQTIIDELGAAGSGGASATANKLQKLSTAIILGKADEWDNYMGVFAKNEGELERLRPEPDGDAEADERNSARAYLVRNGVCGAASPGEVPQTTMCAIGGPMLFTVTETLDLEEDAAAAAGRGGDADSDTAPATPPQSNAE